MARIVSNFFISLDGVVESPDQWHMSYFDEEMGAVVGAGFAQTRAMLMGRRLYDEWAAFWPTATDELAATMNGMQKYVVAHEAFEPTWANTTVIAGDEGEVAERVRTVKEQVGDGDIAMSGSATTVRWLLSAGLLDELVLLQHPVVVGAGQRLFTDEQKLSLGLAHSEALGSGVLHLRYTPA